MIQIILPKVSQEYATITACLHGAKSSWTPTIAGVSYKFGFVHFCICLQCKISGSSAFSIFFHKVLHPKVRKVTDKVFEKKSSDGLGLKGSKSPQNSLKIRFLGFQQKSYSFRYAFLLQYHGANGLYD